MSLLGVNLSKIAPGGKPSLSMEGINSNWWSGSEHPHCVVGFE